MNNRDKTNAQFEVDFNFRMLNKYETNFKRNRDIKNYREQFNSTKQDSLKTLTIREY
jgi:hypothetical protein